MLCSRIKCKTSTSTFSILLIQNRHLLHTFLDVFVHPSVGWNALCFFITMQFTSLADLYTSLVYRRLWVILLASIVICVIFCSTYLFLSICGPLFGATDCRQDIPRTLLYQRKCFTITTQTCFQVIREQWILDVRALTDVYVLDFHYHRFRFQIWQKDSVSKIASISCKSRSFITGKI